MGNCSSLVLRGCLCRILGYMGLGPIIRIRLLGRFGRICCLTGSALWSLSSLCSGFGCISYLWHTSNALNMSN